MNESFSLGGLIPLWILGVGLVWGILESMRTPTPAHRSDYANARRESLRRPI